MLLSNVADALMPLITDTKDLGSGVIGGVECDHLAFRTEEVDWEISDRPRRAALSLPLRHHHHKVTGWPQYTVDVRNWKTGADANHDLAFTPPEGANGSRSEGLPDFDDLAGIYAIKGDQ